MIDDDSARTTPGEDNNRVDRTERSVQSRMRPSARVWRQVFLALALLLCYGFFRQSPGWNETSRYDLVRSIVESGTTRIDAYHDNTGDLSFYGGHYYSDKAPGSSLMGVPVYGLLTVVWNAAGAGTPDRGSAVEALAFVGSGIPTALLVLLLIRFLRPSIGEAWATVIGLGYGLGSIAFPFATMFFGHAASAFFLFASFFMLWRWRTDRRGWQPVLAGLLAGCAVITELPVALGVVVLAGYALWLGRDQALRFVMGGLPVAGVLLAYDWISFGDPFSVGYQFTTGFAAQNSQGILSVVWPSPARAYALLFGQRGLLHLAPWFVMAPLGLLHLRRPSIRAEVVVSLAICIAFLGYNSGALNPFGGWTPGPRYLIPALPFAAVLVGLAPLRLRWLTAALIAVSIALMFVATATTPAAPAALDDPLARLWLPEFVGRYLTDTLAWLRWGLHGAQPLLVLAGGMGLAAMAYLATLRRRSVFAGTSAVAASLLAALILAVSFPLAPPVSMVRAQDGSAVSIVDAGSVDDTSAAPPGLVVWAQLQASGYSVNDTRVVLSVSAPDGTRAWYYRFTISWQPGDRRRVAARWDLTGIAPGDYRLVAEVRSADGGTISAPLIRELTVPAH